jgi:hypothetical protein
MKIKPEFAFSLLPEEFGASTARSFHKLLSIFGKGKKMQQILPPFGIKFLCLKR